MKTQSFRNTVFAIIPLLVLMIFLKRSFSGPLENTQIQGMVSNVATKEKLAYVQILIKNQTTKKFNSCVTNAQGVFIFKNLEPGIYQLTASHIGYEKKSISDIRVVERQVTKIEIHLAVLPATLLKTDELSRQTNKVILPAESKTYNDAIRSVHSEEPYTEPSMGYSKCNTPNRDFNREGYEYISENEFNPARETPLSTFSIDVDRASYSNIRRFITQGSLPPASAVRIEEMINYFSYNYKDPQSEHPFAIYSEVMVCPWNKDHQLALIGLQGKRLKVNALPPANLVFLIDVSGSMMSENKLPLLKKSIGLLINELRENDRVALVVYAGNAGLVLPSTSGKDKESILQALNNLEAGGSTAGGAGINLAYSVARENFIKGGNNRVILATDGDFNVGVSSDGELVKLIEEKREGGIFLTVLGFGTGNYQDAKMEKIADHGNGNYAYIDNIMEAQKTLVSEMGGTLVTIAKDVKMQVEFNPAQIKEYKLIGYENRLLHDRDFNDDTKDAGELGSGHTVTALYELIPVNDPSSGSSLDPLKYQSSNIVDEAPFEKELFTVKFRYKKPDAPKSNLLVHIVNKNIKAINQASENIRFAASVAAFGMILRNSKFKGQSDYNMVISLATEAKGPDVGGYRAELIRLAEISRLLSINTARE